MSAWKNPSRSAWRRNICSTRVASALRSCPAASIAPRSDSGMPSAQPSVIIRRDDRYHSTGGTTKPASPSVFEPNSPAAELSILRSSSCMTTPSKCAITSRGRNRREAGDSVSITQAIR
jgi:hypothetical protein